MNHVPTQPQDLSIVEPYPGGEPQRLFSGDESADRLESAMNRLASALNSHTNAIERQNSQPQWRPSGRSAESPAGRPMIEDISA